MKVAFISRDTLFTGMGGDTIQVLKTADGLRRLGVEVDVFTSSQKIDYDKYDILHGFNVIRPADLILHFQRFKKVKVLSTIYVNYYEYEANSRGGITGFVFRVLGNNLTEYLKTCARWIVNGEKNFSFAYLLRGHGATFRRLVKLSHVLLPNSHSEYRRLSRDYGIEANYAVIPNAIDPALFKEALGQSEKDENLVLCVAKIDGRKNQLNLIRALSNTRFRLILIGKPAPNHLNYYEQCRSEAGPNVEFVPEIKQEALIDYYQKAKVHAMPSWFETTGLSSLEAVAMGCNIVITDKGDTREYFEDYACYCDPANVKSIYDAVCTAAEKKVDPQLRNKVYSEYIWDETARKTLAAYNNCLKSGAGENSHTRNTRNTE